MLDTDAESELRARLLPLVARVGAPECPSVVLPLAQSSSGGSGAFLVRADDGRRYWCKCLENPQSRRVPTNEQLVGRIGRLLDAAVCEVSLIRIPDAIAGWEFRTGVRISAGFAHGSVAVEPVVETRELRHTNDDDNPRRLTTLKLLANLCCSGDPQWLCSVNEENRYYSHDHGHYFPGGPDWTVASLRSNPTQGALWPSVATPIEAEACAAFRQRLATLTVDDIARAFGGLPSTWPITELELVEVALYLDGRRVRLLDVLSKEEQQ